MPTVFVVVLLLFAALTPAGAFAQPPQPAAQDQFVPIDQLPPDEALPAAPLLITAYAFAWIAILGYFWSIWRRLSKVERELIEVTKRVGRR